MFEPTQLMFIYDAVLNYSAIPACADHDTIALHLDLILVKCQEELEKMGYQFEGTATYTVK